MQTKPVRHRAVILLGALLGTAGLAWGQDADRSMLSPQPPVQPRLTQSDRTKLYFKALINPLSFLESGASAGLGQWRDRPWEWRQGASGYGKRYVSSFAQHVTQETLRFGLAALLHEDNRYVPSGRTNIFPRVLYALESTLQSRDDNGVRQVSYSNIASLAGASLLSRTWQPASSGGAGNGAVNFGLAVAFAAGVNVTREFLHR